MTSRLVSWITTLAWETKVFPTAFCTKKAAEAGIKDSDQAFLCLLVDKRFSDHGSMEVLFPYTAKNLPSEIRKGEPAVLWGWRDKSGNYFDHFENNIHNDDMVVVAWRPLPAEETDLRVLAGVSPVDPHHP